MYFYLDACKNSSQKVSNCFGSVRHLSAAASGDKATKTNTAHKRRRQTKGTSQKKKKKTLLSISCIRGGRKAQFAETLFPGKSFTGNCLHVDEKKEKKRCLGMKRPKKVLSRIPHHTPIAQNQLLFLNSHTVFLPHVFVQSPPPPVCVLTIKTQKESRLKWQIQVSQLCSITGSGALTVNLTAPGGGVACSGGRDFAGRGDSPLLPGWLVDVWHLEIIDSGSMATGSCGIVNTRRRDERETELLRCPEALSPHAQECSCQLSARASPGERSAGVCELERT